MIDTKFALLLGVIVFQYNYGYAEGFTDTLTEEIGISALCGVIARPMIANKALRFENISDTEVLQIQAVMKSIHPGAIVNIGGVTVGCSCDEEYSCTNQVPVVAYLPSGSVGVTLSKIDNEWMVGVVQGWWLKYEELFRFKNKGKISLIDSPVSGISFESKVQALHDSMPTCGGSINENITMCTDLFVQE